MGSEKESITKAEYVQLVGILTLASRHNEWLRELADAAREITGEADDCGHTNDAIYNDQDNAERETKELLKRLGVKVTARTS